MVIKELGTKLLDVQGAIEPEEQQDLFALVSEMIADFQERWGEMLSYHSETRQRKRNRQVGVPTYAYSVMVLDPRAKQRLHKVLPFEATTEKCCFTNCNSTS